LFTEKVPCSSCSRVINTFLGDKGCKVALNMLKESAKVGKLAQLAAKLGKGESLIDDVARGVMAAAEFVTKLKSLLKEGIERIFERIRSVFRNSDDLILVDNLTGQEFILSRSQLKSELIESGMTDDAAEMALKCLEDGCFAGNTMVLTKSGSKRIDEIQEGEYILSKDINTGKESYKRVKQVYIKSTDTFIRLNVEGEEIRTTPSHLFFTDDGWWKAADNIKAGDKIVDSSGRLREVYSTELEKLNEPERIYNLNVEDYHTYFVGKSGLLVHNICSPQVTEAISHGKFDYIVNGYESPQGLIYNVTVDENRIEHVLAHGVPDLTKPDHSVFNVANKDIIPLVDEAWAARNGSGVTKVVQTNGNEYFDIPMGRVIGTAGQTSIRVVVEQGTRVIVTAFPI